MKKRLGSYGTAGQMQQRPAPRGGGTLKRDTYRLIKRRELPEFFHHVISWDTAATENESNDPTGATVWGLSREPGKQGLFKLGQLQEWLSTPQLMRRIPDFNLNWPNGCENLVETAGPTGLAAFQMLRESTALVLTPIDPKKLGGGKDERARLASVYLENGLVWLIEDDPDNEGFLDKSDAFPKCKPRDVVDSAIQAILHCCTTYTFEEQRFSYEAVTSADGDSYGLKGSTW
jgi:phage terminase large subunit-like protein